MLKTSSNAANIAASLTRKADGIAARATSKRAAGLAENLRGDDAVNNTGITVSCSGNAVRLNGPDLHRKWIENPDLRDLERHMR